MKKLFFVVFVVLLAIVSIQSEANPVPIKGTGILKKAGSVDHETAKSLLGAFVTFDSIAVEGEDESDIEYLSKYIRTDIPSYPLGRIRVLMLDQLALAAGINPETEEISDEEYFQMIDALTVSKISQSWWGSTGYRSLYIRMDGTGKFGWWTPNRTSEDILMLGDEPAFGLFCLNPIAKPIGEAIVDEGGPDEMVVNTPQRRASRNSGGINTTTGTTGTGTNNSTATATNTVTVYVENPSQQQAPVIVQERRSGLGNFVLGVATGFIGNELLSNRGYRGGGFRDYGGGFSSRRGSSFRSRSSYGWRPRSSSHGWSSGFKPRYSGHSTSVRRYNTSSLNSIRPKNGR